MKFYEEKKMEASQNLQIFLDTGNGYSEENSVKYPIKERRCRIKLELPEQIQNLRFDPGELRAGIRIHRLCWENGMPVRFYTGGVQLEKNLFYFGADDPQILVQEIPENAKTIEIDLEFEDEKETAQKFWAGYQEQEKNRRIREEEIHRQENMLEAVEHSRLWKMYRNVKKI